MIGYVYAKMLIDGTYTTDIKFFIKEDDEKFIEVKAFMDRYKYDTSLKLRTYRSNNKKVFEWRTIDGWLCLFKMKGLSQKLMDIITVILTKSDWKNYTGIQIKADESSIVQKLFSEVGIDLIPRYSKGEKQRLYINKFNKKLLIKNYGGYIYTNKFCDDTLKKRINDYSIKCLNTKEQAHIAETIVNNLKTKEDISTQLYLQRERWRMEDNNPAPDPSDPLYPDPSDPLYPDTEIKNKETIKQESLYLKENVPIPSNDAIASLESNKELVHNTYIGDALTEFRKEAKAEKLNDGVKIMDIDPVKDIFIKYGLMWEAEVITIDGRIVDRPRYEISHKEYVKERDARLKELGITPEQYQKMCEVWYSIDNLED